RGAPPQAGIEGSDLSGSAAGGNGAAAAERIDPRLPAVERNDPASNARLPVSVLRIDRVGKGPAGRRAQTSGATSGAIDTAPALDGRTDIAIVSTLINRIARDSDTLLRTHVRAGREGMLICLVVDASGSMGARRRLAPIKGALLDVVRDAYIHRDRVAIVAFRDGGARVIVDPRTPVEHAASVIRALSAGGRTPLAAGLASAEQLITREKSRDPDRRAVAIVLTDGRALDDREQLAARARMLGRTATAVHVIDAEEGPVRLGVAGALAQAAGGSLHPLTALTSRPRRAA
ncbi:MAG: VWA domain-containing protein, partial [Pseudonocardiaceae bacterium]